MMCGMSALVVRKEKLMGGALFANAIVCAAGTEVRRDVCAGSKSDCEAWCRAIEYLGNGSLGCCAAIGALCDGLRRVDGCLREGEVDGGGRVPDR